MKQAKKTMGILATSGLLLAGTVGVASVAPADAVAAVQPDLQEVTNQQSAPTTGVVSVEKVAGQFSYTQDAITSNEKIASTFNTAVASLCSTVSQHVADENWSVNVNGTQYTASDIKDSTKAKTKVIGCACSANPAGGGAVANVRATGVPIADLVDVTK